MSAGAAISIASAASIPAGSVVGGIVDRVGAQRVLQVANLAQGVGFAAYLVVDSFTGVLLSTVLVSVGRTAFWGSFGATVAVISRPGERGLWFGFLGALRNVGFALGGLVSGLAISIGTETAYAAIVVANAVSYALAYLLLRAVPNTVVHSTYDAGERREGWGVVLRDRRYGLLVLTQAAFSMSMMALNFAMPIYATETLGLPGWVAGALFTINTVMVGCGQGLLVRSLTGRVRNRVLLVANLAFAASYVVLLGATRASVVAATLLVLGGVAIYSPGEMLGGPVLADTGASSPDLV
ncbi:MFS transporter [Nocardioides guangzhouensis]|uniref:MFS transporter n=1 Tax=Nocardioides guangzhouensis TaxID=2497878 RepID=UPI0024825F20|nr:MFS transporter [Nocardioides guangzhouensis]